MRYPICLFLLIIINLQKASSQNNNNLQGKIVYEETTGKNIEYVEMHFSASSYLYFRQLGTEKFLISGKTYKTIEDSLEDVKKNEMRKEFFASQPPPQTWYGEIGKSEVVNSVWINEKVYCVTDTLQFVKWVIEDDTMNLNGLQCQKARGITPKGSKLTAWFTPSIPSSAAPYTLRGLPGLLIQVEGESGIKMSLKMLKLEWPTKGIVNIGPPNNALFVSKSERQAVMDKNNAEAIKLAEYYKKQLEIKKEK